MTEFIKWNTVALIIGFLMDLVIGDPEGWPHPVIWIGKYISFAEKKLRAKGGDLRKSALILTSSTVLLTMCVTAAALWLVSLLGRWPYVVGMSIICWTALSAKSLAREGRGVERALEVSLENGRVQVGRIVGRDTARLSETEILKATVETVAENTTDGIIAPMLCMFIGGPVLAMGFKAASTLDSMVGYLDEKYRDIGWSSAKLDDVLNYIPARICGVLMCISAGICSLDLKNAFRIMVRDHANHLSPNCAWSEAAAAGAMHIMLGGAHEYFGTVIEKPTIGDDDREICRQDIGSMICLMYATVCLAAALLALAAVLI